LGYTHYWYKQKEIPYDRWTDILLDFKKVLPEFIDLLDHETDQKLETSLDRIFLNGIGEEAHETFSFDRVSSGTADEGTDHIFNCCKTARKEYDISVMVALMIAKKHLGKNISVKSDGSNEPDMWQHAKDICQEKLNYGSNWSFDSEGEGEYI